MELNNLKEAFHHVTEKQNLYYSKTEQVIDQMVQEIQKAIEKPQSTTLDCKFVFSELNKTLQDIDPIRQLETKMLELNIALSKYTKALEDSFISDISNETLSVEFDSSTLNQIIASHFYQQGMFDVGDCFINESGDTEVATMRWIFQEMHLILNAMKSRNLDPPLQWAAANWEKLKENGSDILLRLHHLQFVEIVQNGTIKEALKYATTNFTSVENNTDGTHELMGCLLYSNNLHESPYAHLLSPSNWDAVAKEIIRQFHNPMWQSAKSPLCVTIEAGVQALPQLLIVFGIMPDYIFQDFQSTRRLPVAIELDNEFQFHSVYVCPVSEEESTNDNPPMLMHCGHALCKECIGKMFEGGSKVFPFCLCIPFAPRCTNDNPPKLMPCGHVLCKECIGKMYEDGSKVFKCPFCPCLHYAPLCM